MPGEVLCEVGAPFLQRGVGFGRSLTWTTLLNQSEETTSRVCVTPGLFSFCFVFLSRAKRQLTAACCYVTYRNRQREEEEHSWKTSCCCFSSFFFFLLKALQSDKYVTRGKYKKKKKCNSKTCIGCQWVRRVVADQAAMLVKCYWNVCFWCRPNNKYTESFFFKKRFIFIIVETAKLVIFWIWKLN